MKSGFTLLEIIIVLAIIGAIAGVIIPNLTLTVDSQMSSSLRQFTSQVNSAYNDSVFSGRIHRIVLDIKNGEYWVEQAPKDLNQRPPVGAETEQDLQDESDFKDFLKILDRKEKNLANRESFLSTNQNKIFYTIRDIVVKQRETLSPINWEEINNSLLYRQRLKGRVVFAKFSSSLIKNTIDYERILPSQKKVLGYIYILPDGTVTATSIQIGILLKEKGFQIDDTSPQYTLNLNTLTGQFQLLKGFYDAGFLQQKKL